MSLNTYIKTKLTNILIKFSKFYINTFIILINKPNNNLNLYINYKNLIKLAI